MLPKLLFTCSLFTCSFVFGQTHNIDTIIDLKQYTFVDYYDNENIMLLGNYNKTIKTGGWIYYTREGNKLAFGEYKNDSKFGLWVYYNKKDTYKIKWTEKQKNNEKFEFDRKGNLIIIDIVYSSPCFHTYRNDKATMTARAL